MSWVRVPSATPAKRGNSIRISSFLLYIRDLREVLQKFWVKSKKYVDIIFEKHLKGQSEIECFSQRCHYNICIGLCVRTCSPMRTYVQAYAYIRAGLCHRMCEPMRTCAFKNRQLTLNVAKKTLMFSKKLGMFSKNSSTFFKKLGMFFMQRQIGLPFLSLIRSFLFLRSSLHFNPNMHRISRLRMTGYPFILVSAVLPKSFQICLQLVNQKTEYTKSTH